MKRSIFFILCTFCCVILAFSQGKTAKATFLETTHDFGQILEENGNVTCAFTVKNTGDAALLINNVVASCGCTTPEWTKEPIAPGKTGVIKATYAAKGRPGPFAKTITVSSNSSESNSYLTIKGEVISKPVSPEITYPVQMGNLRLKQKTINFDQVKNTEIKTESIDIYNAGNSPMSLKFDKLPKYLTVTSEPVTIPAYGTGKINVVYKGTETKVYGKLPASFNVITGSAVKGSSNTITLNAMIIDDFSKMSQGEKDKAPVINVASSLINFGSVADKNFKNTLLLKISNSGKSALSIRSMKVNSDVVSVTKGNTEVMPGEIVEYNLVIYPKRVTSSVDAILSITSNDPNNSIKEIHIVARP